MGISSAAVWLSGAEPKHKQTINIEQPKQKKRRGVDHGVESLYTALSDWLFKRMPKAIYESDDWEAWKKKISETKEVQLSGDHVAKCEEVLSRVVKPMVTAFNEKHMPLDEAKAWQNTERSLQSHQNDSCRWKVIFEKVEEHVAGSIDVDTFAEAVGGLCNNLIGQNTRWKGFAHRFWRVVRTRRLGARACA